MHSKTKGFAKGFAVDWLGLGPLWRNGSLVLGPGWPFSSEGTGGLGGGVPCHRESRSVAAAGGWCFPGAGQAAGALLTG